MTLMIPSIASKVRDLARVISINLAATRNTCYQETQLWFEGVLKAEAHHWCCKLICAKLTMAVGQRFMVFCNPLCQSYLK